MLYEDYQKVRAVAKTWFAHFKKRQEIANSPVFVRNIFIYNESREGEFYGISSPNLRKISPIERLGDYINLLANIANTYHQKYYCEQNADGTYQIKQDCLNKITRILLPECSLYTDRPFTTATLNLLIQIVYEIAKHQQKNVHLLLSSIAVQMSIPPSEEEKILNTCLYVQCGKKPKIEIFCKANRSTTDVQYRSTKNFQQETSPSYTNPYTVNQAIEEKQLPKIFIPTTTVSNEETPEEKTSTASTVISTNSVSIITTPGGAQFLKCVDICIDHTHNVSKQLIQQLYLPINIPDFTKLITTNLPAKPHHDQTPLLREHTIASDQQADHILTSNSTEQKGTASVSTSVFHIDPENSIATRMKGDLVNKEDFNKISGLSTQNIKISKSTHSNAQQPPEITINNDGPSFSEKYPELTVKHFLENFTVENPPFGDNVKIIAAEEMPLGNFSDDLKEMIKDRNNHAIRANIAVQLQKEPHGQEYNLLISNLDELLIWLESFNNYLNEKYKMSFFEKYFSFFTQSSHMLKLEIYSNIRGFSNLLKKIKQIRDEDETDYNDILDACSGSLQKLQTALNNIRLKQSGHELKNSLTPLEEDEKNAHFLIEKINLMEKVTGINNNPKDLVSTTLDHCDFAKFQPYLEKALVAYKNYKDKWSVRWMFTSRASELCLLKLFSYQNTIEEKLCTIFEFIKNFPDKQLAKDLKATLTDFRKNEEQLFNADNDNELVNHSGKT